MKAISFYTSLSVEIIPCNTFHHVVEGFFGQMAEKKDGLFSYLFP